MNKMRWDAALLRIPTDKIYTVVEVGVWGGEMSEKLLQARPKLKLYQVDRWCEYSKEERELEGDTRMSITTQARFDMKKEQNFEKILPYENRVEVIEMESLKAVNLFSAESVDMVFIDALHSYEGCKADILAWLKIVKSGGWISGHDYINRDGVKKAVDEIFRDRVEVEHDKTWWVRV